MAYRSVHRLRRQFLNLWLAQGISQFGDALLEITLPVWVGLVTKSPTQVAGVAAAELLPAILVGPIAGVIAERFNPKIIMVFTDMLRALAVLLLLELHGVVTAILTLVGFIWSTVDVFYVKNYLGVPGEAATALIAAIGSSFTSQQELLACGILLSITTIFVLSWMWWTKGHYEVTHE